MRSRQIEWAIIAAVLAFMTLTMYYADIVVTSQFSLVFIDSLFDGKFASFYNNALATGIAPEGAVYDIGTYLVFAIWGLPVWILEKLFQIDVVSIVSLLWFKLLLVAFAIGSVWWLKKIAMQLGFREKIAGYIVQLFSVSLLFVFPILVSAQYDVIPLFFMLWGISKWLDNNRKGWLLAFAIAFVMKPFALFTFIIMVIIDEKRVSHIFTTGLIAALPLLVCKGIYMLNPVSAVSNNDFLMVMYTKLMDVYIPAGNGNLSLFLLGLFLVYIAVYLFKPKENRVANGQWLIWYSFLVWALFCILVPIYPYWIIYLSPFLVLVIFFAAAHLRLSLIADLLINISLIFILIVQYPWVYGGESTFGYLLLKPVYEKAAGNGISAVNDIISRFKLYNFQPAFQALLFAMIITVAYLSYQALKDGDSNPDDRENTEDIKDKEEAMMRRVHIWLRVAVLFAFSGLCLFLLVNKL